MAHPLFLVPERHVLVVIDDLCLAIGRERYVHLDFPPPLGTASLQEPRLPGTAFSRSQLDSPQR